MATSSRIETISPSELHEKRNAGEYVDLIDVRTPAEYQEIHVGFASNTPLDRLNPKDVIEQRKANEAEPLYVICKSGGRGRMACEKFHSAGLPNVVNVEGGTLGWEAAGLPVERGKKTISLERQVRITAGALAFLGAVLVPFSPYWAILPGFIGAGLVFAGVTDTCGMGMVLSKMPWNQAAKS